MVINDDGNCALISPPGPAAQWVPLTAPESRPKSLGVLSL
jgi:hypothetical protein